MAGLSWMQIGLGALLVLMLGAVLFLLMGKALIAMLVGAGVAAMRFVLGLLPLGG